MAGGQNTEPSRPDAESRFRAIFEAAGVAVFVVGADGMLAECNPFMVKLLGHTPEELRRMSVKDITHPDDFAQCWDSFKALVDGRRGTYHMEKRYLRRDGGIVWAELTASAVVAAEGHARYVIAVAEDITDRKHAAQALQSSREHLEASVRASNTGLWDWNLRTNTVYYSPEWKIQLGYADDEISDRLDEWQTRLHPDDRQRALAATLHFLRAPSPQFELEFRLRHKDGSYRWILSRASILPGTDGHPQRMLGSHLDITGRKQVEERLREYEKVVESLPEMIMVVDRDYRYLIANRAFLRYRGLERGQVVGHRMSEILDPEVFENTIRPKLDECFNGNVVKYELKHKYPAMDERETSVTYLPIEGPMGITSAACVLEDITERKLAEMHLAIVHQQLTTELQERTRAERRVRALTERLITAQEEERRSIARELHDDLSQEIAALSISVSNLKRDLPKEKHGLRTQSDAIHQRIGRLAESVRHLARQLHPAVLEYSGISEALQSLGAEFGALNEIQVSVQASGEFSDVPAPVGLCLYRVAQEALQNVSKHSTAKNAAVRITRGSGLVQLVIEDRGVGFQETLAGSGRGLGLVSMRERIRLVNGALEIESAPGKGTSVIVTIPC